MLTNNFQMLLCSCPSGCAMNNDTKNTMRSKVKTLFNYWLNVTKPSDYFVVSLPGESNFDFENHCAEQRKDFTRQTQFMYENKRSVYNRFKDINEVEKTEDGGIQAHYIYSDIPKVSKFSVLPTFAWYDFCGIATTDRYNCLDSQPVNKNSVVVVTFNDKPRRKDTLHYKVGLTPDKNNRPDVEKALKQDLKVFGLKHHLFTHRYKSKKNGINMIMLAFTNSKSLYNVYSKTKSRFTNIEQVKEIVMKKKKKDSRVTHNISKLIALQIACGVDDEVLLKNYKLTKHQLAGYKRTVTHKRLQGKLFEYFLTDPACREAMDGISEKVEFVKL